MEGGPNGSQPSMAGVQVSPEAHAAPAGRTRDAWRPRRLVSVIPGPISHRGVESGGKGARSAGVSPAVGRVTAGERRIGRGNGRGEREQRDGPCSLEAPLHPGASNQALSPWAGHRHRPSSRRELCRRASETKL